jgi:hypothetical protein
MERSKCVLASLFLVAVIASAQSPTVDRSSAQGARSPGYWLDHSTGLVWAGQDNGKDVNWRTATKYCHDLRLAGYSDWRLATIDELQGIYDYDAHAPGRAGKNGTEASTWHVKGNLFLTGNQWSSTQILDNRGRPSGLVWYFNFENMYKGKDDGSRFSGRFSDHFRRALCVRQSGKNIPTQ